MELGVFVSATGGVRVAAEAERLGYSVALVPEGFKQDGPSLLGAVAAATSRIRLASGVMQIPARTPVATALTAATLDRISGGRFALGLGVSNPDVSLGWYGVPFDRPLQRTREYVDIVRLALTGAPVRYAGRIHQLPPAGTDEAASLRTAARPEATVPIYLAGVGPASLELVGEIADGWIGVFTSPDLLADSLRHVAKGRDRRPAGSAAASPFEVLPSVPISVGPDARTAADQVRGYFANFIGLGSRERSIYYRRVAELGFGAAADEIRARIQAGDRAGAAAAVPFALMDATSLLGPPERIADRMAQYARAGVTTLGLTLLATNVDEQLATLAVAADAARRLGG